LALLREIGGVLEVADLVDGEYRGAWESVEIVLFECGEVFSVLGC
jgi:hypothetical protein